MLRNSIFLVLVLASLASAGFMKLGGHTAPSKKQKRVDHIQTRHPSGHLLTMKYHTVGLHDDNIIDLSQVKGMIKLTCNVDKTALKASFESIASLHAFASFLQGHTEFMYLTGGMEYNDACVHSKSSHALGVRRLVGGSTNETGLAPTEIALHTVATKYEEIFHDASIKLHSSTSSSSEVPQATNASDPFAFFGQSFMNKELEKQVCLGVNTDKDHGCKQAKKPYTVYSNQLISVDCSDCFMGFETDVFAEIDIEGGSLKRIKGGFKDMSVNAALVVRAQSKVVKWTAASEKVVTFDDPKTTLHFWVGPIPLYMHFNVPVDMKVEADFNMAASAEFGIVGQIHLGNLYAEWSEEEGWTTEALHPEFHLTPKLKGDLLFSGSTKFELSPKLHLVMDEVFNYYATVDPVFTAKVQAKNAETYRLCMDLLYDLDLSHKADFSMNIDWRIIQKNFTAKEFGPADLYHSGDRQFAEYCGDLAAPAAAPTKVAPVAAVKR